VFPDGARLLRHGNTPPHFAGKGVLITTFKGKMSRGGATRPQGSPTAVEFSEPRIESAPCRQPLKAALTGTNRMTGQGTDQRPEVAAVATRNLPPLRPVIEAKIVR
jgi:hypothetical protein